MAKTKRTVTEQIKKTLKVAMELHEKERNEISYEDIIQSCVVALDTKLNNSKTAWDDDDSVLPIFKTLHQALVGQIHDVLVPIQDEQSEQEIRSLINKVVIGYEDKKKRKFYLGALTLLKTKLDKATRSCIFLNKYGEAYLDLYNKFMALAAFRSFKYFCVYLQAVFNTTLWEDNERAFSGYWYYMDKMVLDGAVVFLEKQLPTGTGKSFSDAFAQAWTFGIDIDAVILKICGNDKFTDDCFNNVVKIMTSPRFAEVFPYYSRFECNKDAMFTSCAAKELRFGIVGSTKSTNLRIATKLAETSGVRAKYLYIDDICQPDDTPKEMEKDIAKFRKEWFRRNSDLEHFYVLASGTSYSVYDILSYLKTKNGYDNSVVSEINEFTRVGVSQYIRANAPAVFVSVPALDKNDESVFPKIRSTQVLKNMRDEDFRTFMAMEQQTPLPPDNTPFYYENLREYDFLPSVGTQGRTQYCLASLDPKRRGRDYVSMPIFFEATDPNGSGNKVYYLVDWLYEDKPMQECIPLIAQKIIAHNITQLLAERNTEECIAKLIEDELERRGYTNCVIDDSFSNEPKDKRIMNSEGNIKSRMIFPRFGMYSVINPIGKALNNVYTYTYQGKVEHDDAPDSLSLFDRHFISGNRSRLATVSSFDRRI